MLLLHSDTLPHYGLDRFFNFSVKAGFDGVEIGIGPNFDTQNADYLKLLEKRYQIKIIAFSLVSRKEENFLDGFKTVVKNFPGMTINLNSAEILSFKYKNWIEKEVPKLVRKYGLKLNRKNTPFKLIFGIIPKRSENSLYTLREKGGVCLDVSALWASHEEIMKSIIFLGEKLRHVYLSNVYKNTPYCPPYQGLLPIESFLTRLAQNNFFGNFSLKLNPKEISEGDDEKVLEILTESRKFFEKYFKNNAGYN